MPEMEPKRSQFSGSRLAGVPKQQRCPDLAELGSAGLNQQGGLIHEEFLPQLQGLRAIRVYREMSANDPVAGHPVSVGV